MDSDDDEEYVEKYVVDEKKQQKKRRRPHRSKKKSKSSNKIEEKLKMEENKMEPKKMEESPSMAEAKEEEAVVVSKQQQLSQDKKKESVDVSKQQQQQQQQQSQDKKKESVDVSKQQQQQQQQKKNDENSTIRRNIEKVASMENMGQVLEALNKFVPMSDSNMNIFLYDSNALQILLKNVLTRRPPIQFDVEIEKLFGMCLRINEDSSSSTLSNDVARLLTSKLRTIVDTLGELSSDVCKSVDTSDMASWFAYTLIKRREDLQKHNSVDKDLNSLKTRLGEIENVSQLAANRLIQSKGEIRSRFMYRDIKHNLVHCLQNTVELLSCSNNNNNNNNILNDDVLETRAFYAQLVKPIKELGDRNEREMREIETKIERMQTAHSNRMDPLERKLRTLQRDIEDLTLHRQKLVEEIEQVDKLLEKRKNQVSQEQKRRNELEEQYSKDLKISSESHRELGAIVRKSVQRKRLVDVLNGLSQDLETIMKTSKRSVTSVHSEDSKKYRIQFLTSVRPYLKAEKSCVDFLTRRTESNLNMLSKLEKEKSQLEKSGMATVVPRAYNEVKTKTQELEVKISDDRNVIKKLMSDVLKVFHTVKSIVSESELTAEERSSMHVLAALFRDLDIGNDFRPPPLSGSDKLIVPEEDEIDMILSSSPQVISSSSSSSTSASRSNSPVRKTQSYEQAKPKILKAPLQQRIIVKKKVDSSSSHGNDDGKAKKKKNKTEVKIKFSWASKGKSNKKKKGKTLMELMEEEKQKKDSSTSKILNKGNRDADMI